MKYWSFDAYLERRNLHHAPANDRRAPSPNAKLRRFADLIAGAMTLLYAAAMVGLCAALWFGLTDAAWLMLGALFASSLTTILANVFEARLSDG